MASENLYNPPTSYNFSLSIKDVDYSRDLYGINIITTMSSAYQVVVLDLHVMPHDMILNKVFGQDPIKLKLQFIGNDSIIQEELEYELMFVKSDYKLPINEIFIGNEKDGSQVDKTPVSVVTIVRPSYRIMYSLVNKVYGHDFKAKTIKDIIEDLVKGLPKDLHAELDLGEEDINPTQLAQVIIPPTTFYNSLKYLDDMFGIYYGPAMTFCRGNKVIVKNLASSIKKPEIFTVFHLGFGMEKDDTVKEIETVQDGKKYYTYENVEISEDSNSKWNSIGNNIKHIVKPSDKLYDIIEQDLTELASTYGIIDKDKTMYPDSVIDRTKYYMMHGGYNYSDHFAVSMLSRKIFDLATIKITLQRSVRIEPLLDIGKPVMFKCKTQEYVDITGKYILYSSDITFTRAQGGWQCFSDIELTRTSRLNK